MTDRDLSGRAVFVTGGSGGIGEGVAVRLGRAGARVAVGYHSGKDDAERVCRAIEAAGGEAVAVGGDVSDEGDVQRAFAAAADALGPLYGVVVNAGLQADADVADMSLEQWRRVMRVDLDGAFLTARAFLRQLPDTAEAGGSARGNVVFVSSVHQFIPWAGHANYAAAKGGVEMFMASLAQEVAGRGVRVNAIAPGAIKTPINEDVWSDDAKRAELIKLIPYGRLGRPEDIGNAVAWLMSDQSDYVTGTTLTVDGGMSLYPGFIGNG